MPTRPRDTKLIVEIALLVGGCVVLAAVVNRQKDPGPQRGSVALRKPADAPTAVESQHPVIALPAARSTEGASDPKPAPPTRRESKPRRERQAVPDPAIPATDAPPAEKPKPAKKPRTIEREALAYVGADALAEAIWVDAINNPSVSAHDRSDLIEDLNEDGFPDPRRPTIDDLPLIVNRLALIEDLVPSAMDDVNAAAFAEAYKDLVNMFRRVTEGG
jgi:hypothetical protein